MNRVSTVGVVSPIFNNNGGCADGVGRAMRAPTVGVALALAGRDKSRPYDSHGVDFGFKNTIIKKIHYIPQ